MYSLVRVRLTILLMSGVAIRHARTVQQMQLVCGSGMRLSEEGEKTGKQNKRGGVNK